MATVNYAEKYASKVDERFTQASLTDAAVNKDYDFVGVSTVKVYSIPTVELGDYTLTGMSRYGSPTELGNKVQEMQLSQDKAFTFTIDRKSADDTMGAMEAGKALRREIDEVVIPTLDMYRLAKMVSGAGKTATAGITKENAYAHGKEIAAWMGEKAEKAHSHLPATQSTAGMMSAADKVKLDGLSVNSLQNLTAQVTQNTTCRKLTVTRFGKVVTLSIQSQQKAWASGQTIITLPNAAKPAGELDIPFVMGAAGQGIFRIRTDGVCVCAAVSTGESKSIMTTVTYLAAD